MKQLKIFVRKNDSFDRRQKFHQLAAYFSRTHLRHGRLIVNHKDRQAHLATQPLVVPVVDLPQIVERDAHLLAAIPRQEAIVARLWTRPQIHDGIQLGRMLGPVRVQVRVDGMLDAVHQPSHEAVARKDPLVRLHRPLHKEIPRFFPVWLPALVAQPRAKRVELERMRPALWIPVKERQNVGLVFLFRLVQLMGHVVTHDSVCVYHVLPLGDWLGCNLIQVRRV